MLMGDHEEVIEVKLYQTSQGGSIGDAWGEFVNPPSTTPKLFRSGAWMYFSNDFTRVKDDFVKETGTCDF